MLLGGPPAEPATPPLLENEVLDKLAVMAGQVVLEQQQDLAGVGEGPRQRHDGRIPVTSAEEGEGFASVHGHVVVGEPDFLGAEVAGHVRFDDRREFQDQRVCDRSLCHEITVTRRHRCMKMPERVVPKGDLGPPGGYRPIRAQSSRPSYSGNSLARRVPRFRSPDTSAEVPAANAVAMTSATSLNSASPKPRVASAGVPIRRPDETIGGRGSFGTALPLTVMPTSCSRSSAAWPSSGELRRSTSTR